jgi:predicted O-methyltransferase YrrM
VRPDVRTSAHDLNGVLGTILASADVAAQRPVDPERAQTTFATIASSARTAGDLVEDLVRAASASDSGTDAAVDRDLDYLERIHPPLDPVADELEKSGRGEGVPIVDRDSGRFLALLVTISRAKTILEIGTAFGYSTLWMVRALPDGGKIVTIDPDVQRTTIASGYFKRAGVAGRIEIVNRPALEVLPGLAKERFDLVFIDALKEEYPQYLAGSLPLLRRGGLLVADNLLWGHRASLPAQADDPQTTLVIRKFNEELLRHPALQAAIVPIGDGLGLAVKR